MKKAFRQRGKKTHLRLPVQRLQTSSFQQPNKEPVRLFLQGGAGDEQLSETASHLPLANSDLHDDGQLLQPFLGGSRRRGGIAHLLAFKSLKKQRRYAVHSRTVADFRDGFGESR